METAKIPEKKPFIEREWTEDIEGKLDEDGFFVTPNGSFWDQDYVYFNREGFDRHGGRYDENGEYIPGEGWDDNLNCYESEKEEYKNEKDEDNELDEGYTEDAMMKELAQFNDDDDLFEGKDLIKEDPNIEKVIKHENEKDDFMDENIEDNKNIADDLEEREDDEYEEIEDEEKEKEDKKEENKNKKEGKNIINIEKGKKVFVIKTESGKSFTINGDDSNDEKKDKSLNNNNAQKYDKNGIEYEINYSNNNYDKKYKDKFYYKNKNKSNKNNFHKKVYKNYNFFDDDKNK
jgi:hypothetical protein